MGAIDELLNLAVGDDLFAKSVFIGDKITASQHLRNFDAQQEEILRQCQQRRAEEQRRIEEQRRQEAENQRKIEQERQRREAEEKAKQAVLQREAELRRKEEELLKEKENEIFRQMQQEKEKMAKLLAEQENMAKREAEEANRIKQEAEQVRLLLEKEKAQMQEEKRKMQQEKEEQNRQPPKISIYTRKQMQEKEGEHEEIANEIRSLFISNGVKDSEIVITDVSQDMELASFLKEICNNTDTIKYPLVCAGRLPIGTIVEVRALVKNTEQLESLHCGEYIPDFLTEEQANLLKDGTGSFVGRGVLDHCLDAAEYVVSGVSSLLWLPVNIVTYPFRSAKEELVKAPEDVDFDIVHTNWYWRNLQRRFRFTKDSILRINAAVGDVRAVHPYTTISTIKVVDEENFVINYDGGSSPDYVSAVPEFTSRMLELIKTRCAALGVKPVFIDPDEV